MYSLQYCITLIIILEPRGLVEGLMHKEYLKNCKNTRKSAWNYKDYS